MADVVQSVQGLHVLAFAPSELGLYVKPLNDDGSVEPQTASEALAVSGARVVLDGPMFGTCGGQPVAANQVQEYAQSTCAKLHYLHFAPGLSFAGEPSTTTRGGVLAVMDDGSVVFVAANQRDSVAGAGVRVAVQLDPVLVLHGVAQTMSTGGSNTSVVWRAALGVLSDGRLALAVGPASMQDFANKLAAAGFVTAAYTDGGGSTAMQLADGTRFGHSENRRVASWITVGAPVASSGVGLAVAALLIAGGAYLWTSRKR